MGEEEAEGEKEERGAEEEEEEQWQAKQKSYGVMSFVARLLNTPSVVARPLIMKTAKGQIRRRMAHC